MRIPTEKECLELFEKYKVPPNILLHSRTVCKVSLFLAKKLKEKGVNIDMDLVRSGALLHDLMKAIVIRELKVDKRFKLEKPTEELVKYWKDMKKKYKGKHETEVTYEILKDKFPEFAEFILKIGYSSKAFNKDSGWEEKIIHYADWRVFVDEIIPLKERIDDLYNRYKKGADKKEKIKWVKIKEAGFKLEKEIFNKIGIKPKEINRL